MASCTYCGEQQYLGSSFFRGRGVVEVKRPSFFPKRTSEDSVVFEGLEVVLLDKFFLEMFVVGGLFMFPIFRTSNGLGFSILELSCTH